MVSWQLFLNRKTSVESLRADGKDSSRLDEANDSDPFPCPPQLKPLFHFFKFLQPTLSGHKLRLNMPLTVICSKRDTKEELMWLETNAKGLVQKQDKVLTWRKRLYQQLVDAAGQDPAEQVIAIRNVAHWKGDRHQDAATVLAVTRQNYDMIVNLPIELPFSVQRFVKCRGTHASLYRIVWVDKEVHCYGMNLCNTLKFSDAQALTTVDQLLAQDPHTNPAQILLQHAEALTNYYWVTHNIDAKIHSNLAKIRGTPIAEAVQATKRIVSHVSAQLPGIHFRSMTTEFLRDADSKWWFLRVIDFDAGYRVEVPPSLWEMEDSVSFIPEILRSKRNSNFKPTTSLVSIKHQAILSSHAPQCALCGCPCEFSKAFTHEIAGVLDQQTDSSMLLRSLNAYRVSLKMATETVALLRQRGVCFASWENAILLIRQSTAPTHELAVCFLCYLIYKHEHKLAKIAAEYHLALNTTNGVGELGEQVENGTETEEVDEWSHTAHIFMRPSPFIDNVLQKVNLLHSEELLLPRVLGQDPILPSHYYRLQGHEIDPTCSQLRLVIFFHELQDGGPHAQPTDFLLSYHLGQVFNRLEFEGSKRHTQNRWQLCEARIHYVFATFEDFISYCLDKQILIRMRNSRTNAYEGVGSLSLRPMIMTAKWHGNSLRNESRTDYLVEIRTNHYGILTLKATVGLLVDPVPARYLGDMVRDATFLKEDPHCVYWPPPAFHLRGLFIPTDWIGALMSSEYIVNMPIRRRGFVDTGTDLASTDGNGDKSPTTRLRRRALTKSRLFVHHGASTRDLVSHLSPAKGKEDRKDSSFVLVSRTPPFVAMNLIISKLVGDSTTCVPVVLLANLLRHSNHATVQGGGLMMTWNCPASLHLVPNTSVDMLFTMNLSDAPANVLFALAFLGELLFVMLRNDLIPLVVGRNKLEEFISPYWLQQEADQFKTISRSANVIPQRRIVWNRTVRRSQIAQLNDHFCTQSLAAMEETEHETSSVCAFSTIRKRTCLRTKLRALTLCDIFETLETADSNCIELAEMRSLHKFLEQQKEFNTTSLVTSTSSSSSTSCATGALPSSSSPSSDVKRNASGSTESCPSWSIKQLPEFGSDFLSASDLDALSSIFMQQQKEAFGIALDIVMNNANLTTALHQFDTVGKGDLNFEEFYSLATRALERHIASAAAIREPVHDSFCLRHGRTSAYDADGVCSTCTMEYRDPIIFRLEQSILEQQVDPSDINSDSDHASDNGDLNEQVQVDIKGEGIVADEEEEEKEAVDGLPSIKSKSPRNSSLKSPGASLSSSMSPLSKSPTQSPLRPSLVTSAVDTNTAEPSKVVASLLPETEAKLEETMLGEVMEKLEAAEWHVLHREKSFGKDTFENMITARKLSIILREERRKSAQSLVNAMDLQNKRELMRRASPSASEQAKDKKTTKSKEKSSKKKKKKNKKHHRNLNRELSFHKRRLAMSQSLSKLLEAQLDPFYCHGEQPKQQIDQEEEREEPRNSFDNPRRFVNNTQQLQQHFETNDLLSCMNDMESKRKRLDRRVSKEIEELKQQLTRLV